MANDARVPLYLIRGGQRKPGVPQVLHVGGVEVGHADRARQPHPHRSNHATPRRDAATLLAIGRERDIAGWVRRRDGVWAVAVTRT